MLKTRWFLLKLYFFAAFAFFYQGCANAVEIYYPMLTNVKVTYVSMKNYIIDGDIVLVKFNLSDAEASKQVCDRSCAWQIGQSGDSGSSIEAFPGNISYVYSVTSPDFSRVISWKRLSELLVATNGLTSKHFKIGSAYDPNVISKCIELRFSLSLVGTAPQGWNACTTPPPVDTSCDFGSGTSAGTLDFNFGNLDKAQAVGAQKENKISITCNKDNVPLHFLLLSSTGNTDLSNGMTAEWTINGTSVANAAQSNSFIGGTTAKDITVKATLSGTPASVGPFTGSDVLRIEYN